MTDVLFFVTGLALLIVGGELLVRGAVKTAAHFGLSPLLIGLTLVGFGTSTPELVTSVEAALRGSPGIAIGNIVGSNIANILLIVGIAALLSPMTVSRQALSRDGSVMLASAVLFLGVAYIGHLDRLIGAFLMTLLGAYLLFAYRQERALSQIAPTAAASKREAHDEVLPLDAEPTKGPGAGVIMPLLMAVAGLAIVIAGGKLIVEGAVGIARAAGISDTVIGLTIVAVGTSLPELVTSIVAALRRHADVALGNVIGSNIYNVLGIGGITALISPTAVPSEILRFDGPVMVAVTIVLLLVAGIGRRIGRKHGAVLFACYALYIYAIWPTAG